MGIDIKSISCALYKCFVALPLIFSVAFSSGSSLFCACGSEFCSIDCLNRMLCIEHAARNTHMFEYIIWAFSPFYRICNRMESLRNYIYKGISMSRAQSSLPKCYQFGVSVHVRMCPMPKKQPMLQTAMATTMPMVYVSPSSSSKQ